MQLSFPVVIQQVFIHGDPWGLRDRVRGYLITTRAGRGKAQLKTSSLLHPFLFQFYFWFRRSVDAQVGESAREKGSETETFVYVSHPVPFLQIYVNCLPIYGVVVRSALNTGYRKHARVTHAFSRR